MGCLIGKDNLWCTALKDLLFFLPNKAVGLGVAGQGEVWTGSILDFQCQISLSHCQEAYWFGGGVLKIKFCVFHIYSCIHIDMVSGA